jgi:hypothetical protein
MISSFPNFAASTDSIHFESPFSTCQFLNPFYRMSGPSSAHCTFDAIMEILDLPSSLTQARKVTISLPTSLQGPVYGALPALESTTAIPVLIEHFNMDEQTYKSKAVAVCNGNLIVTERPGAHPLLSVKTNSLEK